MKSLVLVVSAFLLTGCLGTAPVKRNFPEVPQELMTACPDLKQIDKGTDKLSKVIEVVTDNYAQYHECRVKVDMWIDWYKTQKKIFDEVK
jgi:uncharacterized lipoprotein YajG